MSSPNLQPTKLYGNWGINPSKVAIVPCSRSCSRCPTPSSPCGPGRGQVRVLVVAALPGAGPRARTYYGAGGGGSRLFAPEPEPVNRVSAVVDGHLAREAGKKKEGDGPWFVGGPVLVRRRRVRAVPWQVAAGHILAKDEYDVDRYPHLKAWLDKMLARETVRSTLEKFRP
ncbi:hypothetical protein F4809DRAFT_657918 [Biscogniauxia mediterranea]|nr:hypothetical protein F4809DRAFT_657918 [Biscogniauxia mediterranea]